MIINLLTEYGEIILSIIGVFSAIAVITPNKTDNKIIGFLSKIINKLALNIGKAKNDPMA